MNCKNEHFVSFHVFVFHAAAAAATVPDYARVAGVSPNRPLDISI